MDTKLFSNLKYHELVAMQRVFHEAKFGAHIVDDDIPASPIVSHLYKNLLDALLTAELGKKGESSKAEWARWLDLDASREEWGNALVHAKKERAWSTWSDQQRLDYVSDLLSPFHVTEPNLRNFIFLVNSHTSSADSRTQKIFTLPKSKDDNIHSQSDMSYKKPNPA